MNKTKRLPKLLSFLLAAVLTATATFVTAPSEVQAAAPKNSIKSMTVYNTATDSVVKNKGKVTLKSVKGETDLVGIFRVEFEDKKGEPSHEVKTTLNAAGKKILSVESEVGEDGNAYVYVYSKKANKAGKGVLTIKSKAKNAKKKVITKKMTITLKKIDAVPVTGVTLSNTAPKVGDTINAVTTPANANNVAGYQWYADGVAIEGATEASYIVLATDVDKKLKVVVTDAAGTTFESAESNPEV